MVWILNMYHCSICVAFLIQSVFKKCSYAISRQSVVKCLFEIPQVDAQSISNIPLPITETKKSISNAGVLFSFLKRLITLGAKTRAHTESKEN